MHRSEIPEGSYTMPALSTAIDTQQYSKPTCTLNNASNDTTPDQSPPLHQSDKKNSKQDAQMMCMVKAFLPHHQEQSWVLSTSMVSLNDPAASSQGVAKHRFSVPALYKRMNIPGSHTNARQAVLTTHSAAAAAAAVPVGTVGRESTAAAWRSGPVRHAVYACCSQRRNV